MGILGGRGGLFHPFQLGDDIDRVGARQTYRRGGLVLDGLGSGLGLGEG
jgi:hypothetical protein